MPAQYVKPYVKTNKNDYLDAEAIAEAVRRPTMRFVPIKSDEQLDLQALHRVRDRWVAKKDRCDGPNPRISSGAWNCYPKRALLYLVSQLQIIFSDGDASFSGRLLRIPDSRVEA